jgi:hypothetical protein
MMPSNRTELLSFAKIMKNRNLNDARKISFTSKEIWRENQFCVERNLAGKSVLCGKKFGGKISFTSNEIWRENKFYVDRNLAGK